MHLIPRRVVTLLIRLPTTGRVSISTSSAGGDTKCHYSSSFFILLQLLRVAIYSPRIGGRAVSLFYTNYICPQMRQLTSDSECVHKGGDRKGKWMNAKLKAAVNNNLSSEGGTGTRRNWRLRRDTFNEARALTFEPRSSCIWNLNTSPMIL